MENRKKTRICFAASSGGHYEQLMMLKPLMEYARLHDLPLAGPVYGRQSINDYSHNQMREYYRVYAVLQGEKEK